jgi:type VI protein secretion system component Hcp
VVPASAQTSTFLLVPGVAGESTNVHHKGWIDVVNFGQPLESRRKGTLCDAFVVKQLDIASPALWSAVASGVLFPEMRVEMEQAGVRVLDHRLLNVRVLRGAFAGDPLQQASETFELRPQSLTITYTQRDPAPASRSEMCRRRSPVGNASARWPG